MLVGEIPEQTGPDVEQKLKTKSGGELDRPGGVPRGARSRGPQFTPPQRFATFALRLQPFASEFRDGAPVCSENDAFFSRKGGVSFCDGAYVCSENDAGLRRRWNPRGNRRLAADRCSVANIQLPVSPWKIRCESLRFRIASLRIASLRIGIPTSELTELN